MNDNNKISISQLTSSTNVNKITSNDFADLLIEYNSNISQFQNYPNAMLNIIDNNYAVVHIPEYNITPNSIYKYGYSAMPKCYGLLSSVGLDSSGINRINDAPDFQIDGQGTLVGFIDTGIDYMHPSFKHEDNTSRIISIWDQSIDSLDHSPDGFYYGTEYSMEQINLALKSNDPLSIVPSMDHHGHGTMLAGVAAGTKNDDRGFSGVAPNADIVVVKLKQAKPYLKEFFLIPSDALCYQENDIMFGVKYLLQVANILNRPIAICIGMGTGQGDHGGQGFLSRYLSDSGELNGAAVVVAAGNEGNRGHHYYGLIDPFIGSELMELNIGSDETGFSMEIWCIAPNTFYVDIMSPTGELVSCIPPTLDPIQTIKITFQDSIVLIDSQAKESITGDQLLIIRFINPTPGVWKFQITASSSLPHHFHSWLPIDGFISKSTFFFHSNNNTTITSPGNAIVPITVTAYDPITQNLFYYASRGYSRINIPKPDLAAPGVNIYAPTIGNQYVRSTGTSLAAAQTTGVAAMLLEWGLVQGNVPSMNSVMIKRMLIRSARRDPNLTYPNADWGYGMLDIYSTINYLRDEVL